MLIKENDIFRELTNANKWHAAGYTGKGVTVVLLDGDGKAREHMKEYYEDVRNTETEYGHATNVGFDGHQFAPGAQIKMFDYHQRFTEVNSWIKEHKDEIDIINVSLTGIGGMTTPKFLELKDLGIPIVCASGNDDWEDRISFPAKYDWAIAIGAVHYSRRTKEIRVAGYSNEGPMLDAVCFSGIKMLRDDGVKWTVYGTSFASPTAVGLLACYVQWRKEQGLGKLTTEEARTFIRSNTVDLYDKGFDTKSGYGLFVLPEKVPEKRVNDMGKYPITKDYIPFGNSRSGEKLTGPIFGVAHDTGNPGSTAENNRAYFMNQQPSASAHTFIDDKEILEIIPLDEKAWHVQYQKPNDNAKFGYDANDAAIGVELCCGPGIDFDEAYKRYVWYWAYLCKKYNWNPFKDIASHKQLDPERRTDPDNALNRHGITWDQFINDVGSELKMPKDDVTGHWAEETIRKYMEKGIIKGYPDGTIRPDEPLTLARYLIIRERLELKSKKGI